MEEKQRVAIIRNMQQRAEAQRAANEAWAKKVEEAQAVADCLAKKARNHLKRREETVVSTYIC